MINNIIFWIYIFLDILYVLVFVDVILSWLLIFNINLKPKFLSDIMRPMYQNIKKLFPTTFGPFDFTPIIIILIITFLKWLIVVFFPEISSLLQLYRWTF